MIRAILATLLCCLPLGVVAIVYAARVNGQWRAGDLNAALQSADRARRWANWSIGIAVLSVVVTVVAIAVFALILNDQQL